MTLRAEHRGISGNEEGSLEPRQGLLAPVELPTPGEQFLLLALQKIRAGKLCFYFFAAALQKENSSSLSSIRSLLY